jgi:hypothetical protein
MLHVDQVPPKSEPCDHDYPVALGNDRAGVPPAQIRLEKDMSKTRRGR